MNSAAVPVLISMLTQGGLGLAVFLANRRRLPNQCFLLLSLTISGWLATLYLGQETHKIEVTIACMRAASVAGVLILMMLNLLRLSIQRKQPNWRGLLRASRLWLIATAFVVILCQTKAFLVGAQMSAVAGVAPTPIYGKAVYIYAAFFAAAVMSI